MKARNTLALKHKPGTIHSNYGATHPPVRHHKRIILTDDCLPYYSVNVYVYTALFP